jgi:chaperonin cofactor prefoldin
MTIGSEIDKHNKSIEKRLNELEKQNKILSDNIDFLSGQIAKVTVQLHGHIHGLEKPKSESERV